MNTLPTLNNIQDVTVTAPTTNDVLLYTDGEWKNNPAVVVQQIFIASAGQAGFGPLATPYVPGEGQLSVYINGIKQYPGTFTETTPTTFVLSSASRAGDEVLAEVTSLSLPVVQPAMPLHGYKEIFTSTAGQTVIGPFTVPYEVGQGQLNVTINGIRMFPAAFTESSPTTITMNSPLSAGEVILVEHIYGAALPGPIPSVLNDLNDVIITAPATNNALVYNGTSWVNGTVPSGAADYYSTIYDLSPSIAVAGASVVEINPANGFTQYGNLVYHSNGNIPTVFGLVNGLATGRRWTVRVMLVMDGTYSQYLRHDFWEVNGSATTGTISWVRPPASTISMYLGEILLCEFFTIDGGTSWVGTQLIGEAYNPA